MVDSIPQSWKTPQVKFFVLATLTLIIGLLTVFSLSRNLQVIFTHVYYLPIILASFWYQRKGVLYTIIISLFYLTTVFTLSTPDTQAAFAAIGRSLVFILISLIICLLSRTISAREEAVAQSEKKFHAIWQHIQAGIILVDAATHEIIAANPEAERLTGYTEKEMVGKTCHAFICPAERGRCPISDLHQTVDRSERRLLNRHGEQVPVLKTVTKAEIGGRTMLIENYVPLPQPKNP